MIAQLARLSCLILLFAIIATPVTAHAAIIGFDVGKYEYNPGDAGSPPVVGPDSIQLTTGNGQRRSIFFYAPQDITWFKANFTYRATNIRACLTWQGVAFVLQNSPGEVDALGSGFGNLGFAGAAGIEPSAAVTLQSDTGPGRTYNGVFLDGVLGGGAGDTLPVNAFNGRDINVEIEYQDPVLTVTMSEPSAAPFVKEYLVGSLASTLGGSKAYVGFTASTGDGFGNGGANQFLSNFRFVNLPEPNAAALLTIGAGAISAFGWRRRATRIGKV